MFYSNDLLGKKSPLGAIWIAAHGKKLNKGKILQVNISESCKHIMDPEVPHALRLQAILVGGVVIIFNKQQSFLLEECSDMLKRMRALTEPTAPGATLEKKKSKAKAEAITMPAEDMLDAYNVNDLFPTFGSHLLGGGSEHSMGGGAPQVSDDLFVVPTVPEGSEQGRSGLMDGDVRLSLDGLERFDLHMMDQPETFEVPDLNLDLPGMELFAAQPPPSPGPSGALEPLGGGDGELFPVPDMDFGDLGQPGGGEGEGRPGSQTPEPSAGKAPSEGAAPRTKQCKRGGKNSKVKITVDLADEVQIRGKVYREWMLDRSDLLVARPRQRPPAMVSGPIIVGPASTEMLGAQWPAELMGLFDRNASLGATAAKPRKAGAAGAKDVGEGAEDPLEEQERLLDEQLLHDQQGGGDFNFGLDMDMGYGDMPLPDGGEGYGLDGADLAGAGGGAGAGNNPFRRRRRGQREASQGTDDIETERLRAALNNTPGSALDAFYLNQGLTPASNDPLGAASLLLTGRGTNKRNRSSLRPDSEGLLSEKSSDPRAGAGRLSDLGAGDELLGGGEGDLAGLLPVVEEDAEFHGDAELGGGPGSRKRQRLGLGSGGEGGGSGTYGTVSQFQLLEESGPGTQALGAPESMNHSTMALIGLLRGRFDALESQGAGGAQDGAPAQISLFEMAAKLTRGEAAKLFAQILVTKSNDFIKAVQDEPYGDILISRGPYL